MNTPTALKDKAEMLLERRGSATGIGFYLRQTAVRHLVFAAVWSALIAVAWLVEMPSLSFIFAGFWLGILVRDLQWYRRLSAEWDVTQALIDWQKVESIANSN